MGQKASTHVNDSGATGAQDGSPPVGPRGPTAQGKASGLKALFKGGSGGVRPAPHAGGQAEGRALQGEGGSSGALAWDPQVQVQEVGDDEGGAPKPKPYPNLKSAQPVKSALKKKGKELKVRTTNRPWVAMLLCDKCMPCGIAQGGASGASGVGPGQQGWGQQRLALACATDPTVRDQV